MLNTPVHPGYLKSIPKKYTRLYHEYISRNRLDTYEFNDLSLSDSDFLPDGDHVNYDGAMLTTEKFRQHYESIKK